MDYLEGGNLADYINKKNGRISLYEAVRIISYVFSALKDCHSIGLCHTDISPQNILLTENDIPVLIDFGSARQLVGVETRSLDIMITPGFSPLEQYISNGNIGPWTDVYSCGALLYYMITGNDLPPSIDRVYEMQSLEMPQINMLNIKIWNVILNACAIKIDDRIKSIAKFENELNDAIEVGNKKEKHKNSTNNWFSWIKNIFQGRVGVKP